MNTLHRLLATGFAIVTTLASSAAAQIYATDNADNAPYADGTYIGDNGGSWYSAWAVIDNLGGGNFVTTARQTDGLRSFSIFAGSGTGSAHAVDRFCVNMAQRTFTVSTRHDLSSETGFSGVSFRGTGLGPFGATFGGDLLRFGLPGTAQPATPFNTVMVQSATGQQMLTLTGGDGEIRGDVLNWTITFDAFALAYTMGVTSSDGGSAFTTGTLPLNTGVNSIAFGNFNSGTNQDLHFDNPTISEIPEPTALATLGFTTALSALSRRRK
jgi:hypothetical protein